MVVRTEKMMQANGDGIFVLWTSKQIAVRDGVSQQSVSKSIKRLMVNKPDTPVERDGRGRIIKVSLAAYDEFRNRAVDPSQVREKLVTSPETSSLEQARLEGVQLKNDRDRLSHHEELKRLIRRDRVEDAMFVVGKEIGDLVLHLPNNADDVAQAGAKEGVHGIRLELRKIATKLADSIADKLDDVSASAPKEDEVLTS